MENIIINTEIIKLEQLLKFINVVSSGGEAKNIIREGLVKVNGQVEYQRGKQIKDGDTVEVAEAGIFKIVSQ